MDGRARFPSNERPIDSTSSSRPGADGATLIACRRPGTGRHVGRGADLGTRDRADDERVAVETHGQGAVPWLDERARRRNAGPSWRWFRIAIVRVLRARHRRSAGAAGGCRRHGWRSDVDGTARPRQQAQPPHQRVPVEFAPGDARLDPGAARAYRHRRVLRRGRDTRVEVGLKPFELLCVEVEAKRHDLRLAEAELRVVVERIPPRSASSSASSIRGCAPRSAPVTVTRISRRGRRIEHDGRSRCLRQPCPDRCCPALLIRPTSTLPTTVRPGARRARRAPGRRPQLRALAIAQHDEDGERSPPSAGAGGSGEVHTGDVGQREAPEPRRSPSRRS